ncbi:MAG: hypothetical protein K2O45_05575 [Oscillospiraceae bacterium]|nr:hypothetical protein [Oscillospiraceae bacterium]
MNGKKEYVKLWLSYTDYFQAYTPEQVGRIVLAMLACKDTGEEPDFQGPERFIWPAIRRDIAEACEAQATAAERARENGKKGGRPRKSPPADKEEAPPGFPETQKTTWTKDMDIDKDHCQGQGQDQGERQGYAWARKKMASADRLLAQLIREAKEESATQEPELFT